jgi:hypothetical protein
MNADKHGLEKGFISLMCHPGGMENSSKIFIDLPFSIADSAQETKEQAYHCGQACGPANDSDH